MAMFNLVKFSSKERRLKLQLNTNTLFNSWLLFPRLLTPQMSWIGGLVHKTEDRNPIYFLWAVISDIMTSHPGINIIELKLV